MKNSFFGDACNINGSFAVIEGEYGNVFSA